MTNYGRLELNARGFKYDANLDKAADLFDSDPDAWARLPITLQDHSGIYRDLRNHHRAAVAAGLVTDDRGSQTVSG